MIAVYAQASGRQGLESAMNGVVVGNDHPKFSELRERGRATSSANPIRIGGFELRYSHGVARLVFDDTDADQDGSPITVVVDMDRAKGNLDAAVAAAVKGVRAIHRDVDATGLQELIQLATDVHSSYLTRRRIILGGSVIIVAGVMIAAAIFIVTAVPKQ